MKHEEGYFMAQFIDRRLNGKNKSAVNRQRFLKRHKEQIKESVADAVNRRSITNTETGEDVSILTKTSMSLYFIKAKVVFANEFIPVTTNSLLVIKLSVPKVAVKVAALEKGTPVQMEKAKTNLYSKYQKMSTSIFCSKISSCLI